MTIFATMFVEFIDGLFGDAENGRNGW